MNQPTYDRLARLLDVRFTGLTDGQVLVWDETAGRWKNEDSAGGASAWGSITGTLGEQTDLQTALNAKLSTTAAAAAYQPLSSGLTTLAGSTLGATGLSLLGAANPAAARTTLGLPATGSFTVANEGADTTCFPLFSTAATGDLDPKSNARLKFNAETQTLESRSVTVAADGLLTATNTFINGTLTIGNGGMVTFLASGLALSPGFVSSAPNSALTGTVSVSGTAVTGTGTAFTSELAAYDHIEVDGYVMTIDEVLSDTSATVRGGGPPLTDRPFMLVPASGIIADYNNDQYIRGGTTYIDGRVEIGSIGTLGYLLLNGAADSVTAEMNQAGVNGADASNAVQLFSTWNTSGNPALVYGNVSNIASGATSSLVRLQVDNADVFRVTKTGAVVSAATTLTLGAYTLTASATGTLAILGANDFGGGNQTNMGAATATTFSGVRLRVGYDAPESIVDPNLGALQLLSPESTAACFSITQDNVGTAHLGIPAGYSYPNAPFVLGTDGVGFTFRLNPTSSLAAGTPLAGLTYTGLDLAGSITIGGALNLPKTITAGGTTGAQTIDKISGSVNFAAAATSLVVTNSLVTTNSVIIPSIGTNDATAAGLKVVAGSGSFTLYFGTAATAETRVNFILTN